MAIRQEHWSPTADEAVNSFSTDHKANRCTPRTLAHYRSRLGGFSRFLTSQNIHRINGIAPTHIRLYYIHLQEKELSSHTLKLQSNYLTAVKILQLLDVGETEQERAVRLILLDTGLRAKGD